MTGKETDYEFPGDDATERELFLRWLGYLRGAVLRNIHGRGEEEFFPGPELSVQAVTAGYGDRAAATDQIVRSLPLDAPCGRREGTTLRWVLLHLINEAARHAGHADAVRELLDGATGE